MTEFYQNIMFLLLGLYVVFDRYKLNWNVHDSLEHKI